MYSKCTRYLISIQYFCMASIGDFFLNKQCPNMLLKKNNTYFEILYIVREVL